ncbi:MAG: TonB-dependent receptor [Ginsengibacter sp.]
MKIAKAILFLLTFYITATAQKPASKQDTILNSRLLDSVIIISYLNQNILKQLPQVQGTYIFAGKKTEMIELAQLPADITNKTGRQVFAKIPGVFVYDMDGSGNQINIASRGLDPHRGWEFNIRKDGIITNSDMYGYPASHYSMPLESIGRIELVRGTGSLQYGAQFGGMLNYVTKQGDTTRPFSFESINTAGSFNLLSTYNAIGGKMGKFKYYAYIHKKSRDGYRDNEHTNSEAEDINVTYESARISIRMEWARSKYLYRIPGPLTDNMFYADPTQATRSRNYFSPDIHVPAVTLNWQIASQTKLQLTTSAVLGRRNSVQFDKPTNVADTINSITLQYNSRQVDIDRFNSYTAELRLLQQYSLGKQTSSLAAGIQYMNNDLHRTQLGKGTTGSDYDLTLTEPLWGRDMHFKTHNVALFAENKFQLLKNLSANIGARVEMGRTDMSGTIVYYPENDIPVTIKHRFPLLGANISYSFYKSMEFYGGWSEAYRPMLFKDIIPASLFEKVDPKIKDAKGYNAEFGFRGNWKFLRWDINTFLMQYDNRFGTLAQTDNAGAFYTYRTNIGNSLTKGAEIFMQGDWLIANKMIFSVFTSTAFMHARYTNGNIKSGNSNVEVTGNKVESAPDNITRNGSSIRYKKASFSVLYSYTGKTFADALNTVEPLKTTGAVGIVPSYGILDMNASFRFSKNLEARINVSNVTNKQYFTKRPTFYPGPGVWPSDGRNFSASIAVRL